MQFYKYGRMPCTHCLSYCRTDIMLRILVLCSLPLAHSIVVQDPLPSASDYKYSYTIEGPYTGDSQSQHEVRQGDFVSGAYTIVGPDGTKRIVEYTADPTHGFQAVVIQEPMEETVPMRRIPYVSKTRFNTQQIYNLEGAKLPLQMDIGNFFTPSDEINDEKIKFHEGRYFEPAE